jgi:hypothetical protein
MVARKPGEEANGRSECPRTGKEMSRDHTPGLHTLFASSGRCKTCSNVLCSRQHSHTGSTPSAGGRGLQGIITQVSTLIDDMSTDAGETTTPVGCEKRNCVVGRCCENSHTSVCNWCNYVTRCWSKTSRPFGWERSNCVAGEYETGHCVNDAFVR